MVLISFNAVCYWVSIIRRSDMVFTDNTRLVVNCEYNRLIPSGWIRLNKYTLKTATKRSWKLRILNHHGGAICWKIIVVVAASVSKFQSASVKSHAKLIGAITKLIGRQIALQPMCNAHQLSSRSGRNKKENTFLDE